MRTEFPEERLRDPDIARSNAILRSCVHCGMCTATCPTYQVLHDELDSPRGRIYLIKDMLENDRDPDERTVRHIDRCLGCLACMTTCPSGVDYMHLVDHARAYIEERYRRPLLDRALRWALSRILPYPGRFRLALAAARLARPFAFLAPDARLRAMLGLAPERVPPASRNDDPGTFPPAPGTARRMRVALMTGCAQRALDTGINDATIRLLTRLGCEVVVAEGAGCCGALTHHMGRKAESHETAARNVRAWARELDGEGLDAIAINASGCGTTVKDYGHMFRDTPLAADAERVAAKVRDVTELLVGSGLVEDAGPPASPESDVGGRGMVVAYHAACSLQHGQRVRDAPKTLLERAGYVVREPANAHLCCGSAGTYNLMQPEISGELGARKTKSLESCGAEVVAAGNIGCMIQIGARTSLPVVHTVELLDWAWGGPRPRALGGAPAPGFVE